jgi:hypothetical protein
MIATLDHGVPRGLPSGTPHENIDLARSACIAIGQAAINAHLGIALETRRDPAHHVFEIPARLRHAVPLR